MRFMSTDVNVAFQQAAHKVLLDDDNLLPLLHLTVDYQGKDSKGEFILWSLPGTENRFHLFCLFGAIQWFYSCTAALNGRSAAG